MQNMKEHVEWIGIGSSKSSKWNSEWSDKHEKTLGDYESLKMFNVLTERETRYDFDKLTEVRKHS